MVRVGRWDIPSDSLQLSEGDPLRGEANNDICSLFITSWVSVLNDSPLQSAKDRPVRAVTRLLREIRVDGLQVVIKRYAGYADRMMRSASLIDSTHPQGEWMPEMVRTPIMREYHEWYLTGEPELFAWMLTFCLFGKKVDVDDPALRDAAFRSWLQVEDRLSRLTLNPDLLKGLRIILDKLLPRIPEVPYKFHHGTGSVAERQVWGSLMKTSVLHDNPKLRKAFFMPNSINGFGMLSGAEESAEFASLIDSTKDSIDNSLWRLVAKDQSKYRSICMEPAVFMAAQQGVRHWLMAMIRHGVGRRFIRISDQGRNRALARYGSETGKIDTIDLSSASDSVSKDLVHAIFPSRVAFYLLATRTSLVDLGDSTPLMRVKKFAPMGSAVCFPTQCLVFAAASIYAAVCHRSGAPEGFVLDASYITDKRVHDAINSFSAEVSPGSTRKYEPLGVYGDDIAIDCRLSGHLMSVLTLLGFEVNSSKSFRGEQAFRESCGGWFIRGVEVTPLLFRVKRYTGVGTPEHLASVVDGANNALDHGYRYYRMVLVRHALRVPIEGVSQRRLNPIRFSLDGSGLSIKSTAPTNHHLTWSYPVVANRILPAHKKKRMADITQCECVRSLMLTRSEESVAFYNSVRDGDIEEAKPQYQRHEYYRWYRDWSGRSTPSEPTDEDDVPPAKMDTRGTRLVQGWTPVRE